MLRRSISTFLMVSALLLGLIVMAPAHSQVHAWITPQETDAALEAPGWLEWLRALFAVESVSAASCDPDNHCAANACTPEFCPCSSNPCAANACDPSLCDNGGDDGGGGVFDPGG